MDKYFLQNYDIRNQFQELLKNANILDFDHAFIMYMIEAKLFLVTCMDVKVFVEDVFLPFDLSNLPSLSKSCFLKDGFLYDLPSWLVPVEINDELCLGYYQHLLEYEGDIINDKKEIIGKWGLYMDLVKYFELD
jgi:hypothetical protein